MAIHMINQKLNATWKHETIGKKEIEGEITAKRICDSCNKQLSDEKIYDGFRCINKHIFCKECANSEEFIGVLFCFKETTNGICNGELYRII